MTGKFTLKTWAAQVTVLLCLSIGVFITMALITQERIREIGVLKALGAPNTTVIRQFVAETQ